MRLDNAEAVKEHVAQVKDVPENVLAFDLTGGIGGETAEEMFVIFNPNTEDAEVALPPGGWSVYIEGGKAGTEALKGVSGKVSVEPISAMVLLKDDSVPVTEEPEAAGDPSEGADTGEDGREPVEKESISGVLIGVIGAVALAVVGGILILLGNRKKK